MSNSFRIEESELKAWHNVLAPRMDLRGVAAIAKEIEAHLAKKDADGTVAVSRHQLFTWAEALQGASMRDGSGALPAVVSDMRAILGGKAEAAAQATKASMRAPDVSPALAGRAVPPVSYAPPPPVTYGAPPVSYGVPPVTYGGGSGGGARFVEGVELRDAVTDMIRSARGDLFIISPWDTGIETIISQITATSPGLKILLVSRRPGQETPAYHQAMDQLGRRKAVTAFSNHIQTRMIIQDSDRALVGAASVPGPASREGGILVTDRASVASIRAHFERVHAEVVGGR